MRRKSSPITNFANFSPAVENYHTVTYQVTYSFDYKSAKFYSSVQRSDKITLLLSTTTWHFW